ncbi:single-stranded-DNA-specific exonuclease [Desulfarculales bacterium]
MVDFLRQAGASVVWNLLQRLRDGYGFSPGAARRLYGARAQLIITVDCGISDNAGVEAAGKLGLPVVITDHHEPQARRGSPQQPVGIGVKLSRMPSSTGAAALFKPEVWPAPCFRSSLSSGREYSMP